MTYRRTPKVGAMIALGVAVLLGFSASSTAQDYMGMVEQYGWNVQSTLQTEIMNNAGRMTMQQSLGQGGQGSEVAQAWPAHISENAVASHVFTVDELAAMNQADPDRFADIVDGQVITVRGIVERNSQSDSSFNLLGSPDAGYHLWAFWRRNFDLPANNSSIALRGMVEVERRSFLTMREAEFVIVDPAPSGQREDTSRPAASAADLQFTPSEVITREVNALLTRTLTPALAPGQSPEAFLALLNSGVAQSSFRQFLEEEGFSVSDLGDVLAGELIVLWQVAHNEPDTDEPEGYQAIRTAMREALIEAGWISLLSDAQKQTYAEIVGTGSILIVARYLNALENGDSAVVEETRADARALAQEHAGIDLLAFELTPSGFVAR